MSKLFLAITVGLFVVLLTAHQCLAQSSEPQQLEEVVVSSTRLQDIPVDIRRVPANISVITQKEIKESGARTIQEVLQYQPGVTIFDQVGNDFQQTIVLRGFVNDGIIPVTVLVDGVRVNAPDFNAVDFDVVPFEDVERIEILPGPNSIYGKNALGGVINIITKRGAKEPQATIEGAWGSFHRERYRGNTSGALGHYDYYVGVDRETENGFRDQSAARITQLFGKFGFRPNETTDLSMTLTHANNHLLQAGSLTEAELAVNRRQNPTPGDFQDNELNKITVDGRKKLSSSLSVAVNGFYLHQNRHFFTSGLFLSGTSATNIFSGGGTLQVTHDTRIADHRNVLVAGGEFNRHDFDITGANTFSPTNTVSGENIYAGFVQDSFNITEALALVAGARYDVDRLDFTDNLNSSVSGQKNFFRLTPRAGVTYLVTDTLSLYASYSEGFRTPAQSELFQVVGSSNPGLGPVKSRNYEIGGRWQSDRVKAAVALYQADVRDEIFFICTDPTCAQGTNRNLDKTRRRGIEGSVKVRPNKWFDMYANYAFTEATFQSSFVEFDAVSFGTQVVQAGDSLPLVPKHQLAAGLNTYPVEGMTLSLNSLYVSTKFMFGDEGNNQKRLPGYFLLNARAAYEWKVRREIIGFFLQVHNLLDTKYETTGRFIGSPSPVFVPAPGISLFGGLSIRFQ